VFDFPGGSEYVGESMMRHLNLIPLAVACLVLLAPACGEPPSKPGNVLLVIVDTARADHFSTFGYLRPTSPNLDRLAAEGQRFDSAWSQSPWTLPSIATILTGQPPHVHGATRGRQGIHPVRDEVETLAQRLSSVGYATAAFINVLWCAPEVSGLDRGFDLYDHRETDESNRGHRNAAETTDAVLAWLDRAGDDPFFVVTHYFDPHLTYDPPPPHDTIYERGDGARVPPGFGSASQVFAIRDGRIRLTPEQRESLIARYDGEIRFTDEQFGRLRDGLVQRGLWDDTLVIFVADHGEEFWDHGGFEHGHSHHRELLRAPLIVRRPDGLSGEVSDDRVRQIDIAPTILDFAGVEPPGDMSGFVLGTHDADYAVAEGSLWAGDLVSVRSDRGTLILNRDDGAATFYAPDDTFELTPLPVESQDARDLLDLLESLPAAGTTETSPNPLTEEQLERLRSLGYVQ
jgi:arylsulfatase A-like enzyme